MVKEIIRPTESHLKAWVSMRYDLWPNHTVDELLSEALEILSTPSVTPVFLCVDKNHEPIGFLEGGIRSYAEGCETNKVGYVEGWYVKQEQRGNGYGAALMKSFFTWCQENKISEVGSDTWLWNENSINAHKAIGFTETERLVHFIKKL